MKGSPLLNRLIVAQRTHPWAFLLVACLVTLVAGGLAATLRIDASYEALLPTDAKELNVVRSVRERTGGLRHIVLAVTGEKRAARHAFADKLAAELRALEGVRHADFRFPVRFLEEHAVWLVELETLRTLTRSAERAVDRLRTADDDRALARLGKELQGILKSQRARIPFHEVQESRDGRTSFLWVVPATNPNQLRAGQRLLRKIEETSARLEPAKQGLSVRASGMLVLYREQHRLISRDLRNASLVALLLCALLVVAGLRRWSAPLLVSAALLPGVIWTFGLMRLRSDTVNLVTGFLVPVLLGLGIDFALHLLMRYGQEQPGVPVEQAVERSVLGTWRPAATSALTTAATFFCFGLARFPGFREFGLVAGTGVLLTLLSTFLILPPLLVVVGRRTQRSQQTPPRRANTALGLNRPFPLQRLVILPVIILCGLAVYGVINARQIPYYNDFRRLHGSLPEAEFNDWVNKNLGFATNPAVVVARSPDDARRIATMARRAQRTTHSRGAFGIARVLAATDLLPDRIAERRALIQRLRLALRHRALAKAAARSPRLLLGLGYAERLLDSKPFTMEAVPALLRRRFVTRDGKAFLVYLWPTKRVESDLLALAWVKEISQLSTKLRQQGVRVEIADEVFIHGWISALVAHDAPRLIPAAFLVVLLILLIDLRSIRYTVLLLLPLLVGIFAFVGCAHALGLHFNMFNLLAIPTMLGIGIDAAVHINHRYRAEGSGSLGLVLRSTGVAVLLASATSAAGFGSSLVCNHLGLRSLGTMALLGIAATTATALFLLPTLLALIERLGARRSQT